MNAKELYHIILKLQITASTNVKKEILKGISSDDKLFFKYISYVYDEVNYIYGKSKLPPMIEIDDTMDTDDQLEEMFALLDDMVSGKLKGNSSDEAMVDYCIAKPTFYTELLFYVIKRDIKAKISAKIINSVFGRVIPIAPYMRCESESYMSKRIVYMTDGINHGALAESKADGAFLNVIIDPKYDEVKCTTRYGRKFEGNYFLNTLSVIAELLNFNQSMVLHGELLLKDENGKIMNRQTGNGKINKYAKRVSTKKELLKKIDNAKTSAAEKKAVDVLNKHIKEWDYIAQNLVYEIWDIIPEEQWLNLEYNRCTIDRFNLVKQVQSKYNEYLAETDLDIGNCELRLIDYEIVYDNEQAMNFYQRQLDDGLEGMVIKNLDAKWMHDTNRGGIVKLKDFKENDLIITGYNMADSSSEFEGGIGSLICESSDGLVKVNVSGMKRDQRGLERVDKNDSSKGLQVIEDFDFNQFTGKIIAVKYNEMLKDKDSDTYSLFLPNVLEIRESSDKTQADDFNKIKKDSKYKGK